jgi:hypothetical protein
MTADLDAIGKATEWLANHEEMESQGYNGTSSDYICADLLRPLLAEIARLKAERDTAELSVKNCARLLASAEAEVAEAWAKAISEAIQVAEGRLFGNVEFGEFRVHSQIEIVRELRSMLVRALARNADGDE